MAAIYQEVELTWQDETYTVTPTYRMIQKIEQRYSIAGMAARIVNGDPPLSHIAEVVSILLTAAGAKNASPEAVYENITVEPDADHVGTLCTLILTAFVPQRRDAGNAEAPKPGAKRKKK